uniref:Tolllike receptor 6 [Tribolium castaneum] n=1 Tax=Lepeophtheirus salmonis TaxID=72036 RepID=A0A0K2T2M9_LEPSM
MVWIGPVPSSLAAFYLFSVVICIFVNGFPVPDDCTSSPISGGGVAAGISLVCSLSAINSDSEKTNFSVIPSEQALSLIVMCKDNLIMSKLEPGGFISLKKLRYLEIKDCQLTAIPDEAFAGLTDLIALKIRSTSSFVVENEAFAGLTSLQTLDLAQNSIISLSKKSFCNLAQLKLLNLSRNEIESTVTIGSHECINDLHNLETLDLSYNQIWYFMINNPFVSNIIVKNNALATLEEDSLKNVVNLKLLDLSNNVIENLPLNFVSESYLLEEIILSNNSILYLPDEVFNNQSSLTTLDLSGNRLQSISSKVFSGCGMRLKKLDLSYNDLKGLSSNAFLELSALHTLNLNYNSLYKLPSLQSIGKTLTNLYLSSNFLGSEMEDIGLIDDLESLSHLTLNHNGIENIPPMFFLNSTHSINVLDLSHNNFSIIPDAVRSLQNLQSFSISNNQIKELGALSMRHLWRFQADHNLLNKIDSSNFKNMMHLQVLDLSSNSIYDVDSGSFEMNTRLKAIRLDNNNISVVMNIFQDLPNLTWLNLSANSISAFDYAMVPKTIQWLDLHNNLLKSLDNRFSVEDLNLLGHLDASFNQIQEIGPQNIPNNIITLLLNDNQISQMGPYTFYKKKKLKKVDLTLNRMENITSNALRLSSELEFNVDIEFYFGGNPIKCDCQMTWFKSINSVNGLQMFPTVADLESIYCELVYSREQSFVPLVEAESDNFLCEYKAHCFALCQCCEYDACDCEMTCPSNCTCYHDNSWAKNIAECSFSNLKGLPDRLPMDATEIFLDGNEISVVQSHTFIGRKNLKILYLNESQVRYLPNNSFNGLIALEELHLENNHITRLEGSEFNGLFRLNKLYLHKNKISFVNNFTFKELKALETLYIHGNHISIFPPWVFFQNPLLATLTLSENPWNCDCNYMKRFENWIEGFHGKILDLYYVSCSKGIRIRGNTCPSTTDTTNLQSFVEDSERNKRIILEPSTTDLILPLVSSVVILSLIIIVIILAFIFRYEVRVWVYSKFGIRLFDKISQDQSIREKDMLYDAFFAYSNNDDVFVRQVLAPELEHGSHSYKICLLYRDLPTQPSYIADTIVQASGESRRTIIILSDNFLKSEWSRYNYKSGLHQAFGTFKNAYNLIVIILGNVSLRDLDPDIRHYFSSSVIIRWGDKLFWDKLKYSLPDVENADESSVINLQDVRHSSTYSFNYDSCQQSNSSIRTMTIHI